MGYLTTYADVVSKVDALGEFGGDYVGPACPAPTPPGANSVEGTNRSRHEDQLSTEQPADPIKAQVRSKPRGAGTSAGKLSLKCAAWLASCQSASAFMFPSRTP